jgi:hypothetical protein
MWLFSSIRRLRLGFLERRHALIRITFGVGMLIFIGPLVFDLISDFAQTATEDTFHASADSPFQTELRVSRINVDTIAKTASGDAVVTVNANRMTAEIDQVVLRFWR